MKSEIKLLALDLDGTLLNSQKEISQENLSAISEARAKGIHVVITTGRPLVSIHAILEQLSMLTQDDFSITYNGGLVQRNTGEILSKKTFSLTEAEEIKNLTNDLGLPCDILSENIAYITPSKRPSLYPEVNKFVTFKTAEVRDFPENTVLNKIIVCTDPDYLDEQISKIPADFGKKFEIFKSQVHLLEIMPKGINKAYGLTQLIKLLDLKPENVAAMGDAENDRSMIEWAGTGVAMGNAVPAIKDTADITLKLTNDENGVADFIINNILD